MNPSELGPIGGTGQPQPAPRPTLNPILAIARGASRLLHRRLPGPIVAVVAVAALIGAGWIAGGPVSFPSLFSASAASAPNAQPGYVDNWTDTSGGTTKELTPPMPAATAAPTAGPAVDGNYAAVTDTTLIVRSGQVTLEVSDIDKAVSAAQTAITGLGGYVSDSSRSGVDQYATASVTYRLPVAHWDAALKAIHGVGDKVLFEQTGSSDVTAQAIDMDARLANLKATESALQAIMARATEIKDVLAVQAQLTEVRGEIESLSAQSNHLKDQAAMSTLTVTFQLPSQTVTVQATNEWTLGSQVDQALAALVRIAQGLATLVIWALIVALPAALGLLVLFGLWRLVRRLGRRGRRGDEIAPAA